jgi:type I restriction enzyme, S subunit
MSTKAQSIEEEPRAPESELPEGWAVTSISQVLSINYGKGLKASKRRDGKVLVYGSNGIVGKHDAALTKGPAIIIGRKGTVGAVHLSSSACWPIDTTYYVDAFCGLNAAYLVRYLRKLNLVEFDTSTAVPGLNRDDIYKQNLLVAPFNEQERIASTIVGLETSLESVIERLRTAELKTKFFRQAVLSAACSGKLTEDWRQRKKSPGSSKKLLTRILERRRELFIANRTRKYEEPLAPKDSDQEFPDTWVCATVDQLTSLVTSGSRGWARYYSNSGPLFIRAENINRDYLDTKDIAHVLPPQGAEGTRTRVETSDLLITITGANVTKSALVDREIGQAYVSQHIGLVRPVEILTAPFLYLWIVSPSHGRRKLVEDAYGAGKPGLNLDNIREVPVALPPLEEQEEIVRRVDGLFKLADAIERRVAAATFRSKKLTHAILAKTFRGELVLTEAELARREQRDYEPASALLERIKKNRASAEEEPKESQKRRAGTRQTTRATS